MSNEPDSGLRPQRVEWVAEATEGQAPANPSYNLYSDTVVETTWNVSNSMEGRDAIGSPDSEGHYRGPEEATATFTYHLQQEIASGTAEYDFATRNAANEFPNSHTVVERQVFESGGNAGAGIRKYWVGKGGKGASINIEGDPSASEPIPVELEYQFEKGREYLIHQPSSSTTLDVVSTDANDTSQTLTIEDEGAGTTEDVALNGTTAVTTTASFSDIDAASLDAECIGDVTVKDSSGNVLLTIYGSEQYSDGATPVEGDLGVPALGTGSHATAIGQSYEVFRGTQILEQSTSHANLEDYDLTNFVITIENDIGTTNRTDSVRMRLNEGQRTVSVEGDVLGSAAAYNSVKDHLTNTGDQLSWTLGYTKITIPHAVVTESPEDTTSAGEAAIEKSVTFEASARDGSGTSVDVIQFATA